VFPCRSELVKGEGFYRAAWGFLRPVSATGAVVADSDGELVEDTSVMDGSLVLRKPTLRKIAMYRYQEPSWAEARVHDDSLTTAAALIAASERAVSDPFRADGGAAQPGADADAGTYGYGYARPQELVHRDAPTLAGVAMVPSPAVFLQYRMRRRVAAPFCLSVAVAAVPAPPPTTVRRRPRHEAEAEVATLTLDMLQREKLLRGGVSTTDTRASAAADSAADPSGATLLRTRCSRGAPLCVRPRWCTHSRRLLLSWHSCR
jgi:hypothetical protein